MTGGDGNQTTNLPIPILSHSLLFSSLLFSSLGAKITISSRHLLRNYCSQRTQIMTICSLVSYLSPHNRTRQAHVDSLEGDQGVWREVTAPCCSVTLLFQDSDVTSHGLGVGLQWAAVSASDKIFTTGADC